MFGCFVLNDQEFYMNGFKNTRTTAFMSLKLAAVPLLLAGCACGDLPTQITTTAKERGARVEQPVTPRVDTGTVFDIRRGQLFVSRPGGAMAQVPELVRFAFDNSLLPPAARRFLRVHADYLRQNPDKQITIEGHCDERGTREYNLALGDLRAKAVADYLRSRGVRQNQIKTVSFGEERPVDPASNETAWAQNRRAVIIHQ